MSALIKLNTILALLSEMEAGDRDIALSIINSHYGTVSAQPLDGEPVSYPRYGAGQYGVVTDQWGRPLIPAPSDALNPSLANNVQTDAVAPPAQATEETPHRPVVMEPTELPDDSPLSPGDMNIKGARLFGYMGDRYWFGQAHPIARCHLHDFKPDQLIPLPVLECYLERLYEDTDCENDGRFWAAGPTGETCIYDITTGETYPISASSSTEHPNTHDVHQSPGHAWETAIWPPVYSKSTIPPVTDWRLLDPDCDYLLTFAGRITPDSLEHFHVRRVAHLTTRDAVQDVLDDDAVLPRNESELTQVLDNLSIGPIRSLFPAPHEFWTMESAADIAAPGNGLRWVISLVPVNSIRCAGEGYSRPVVAREFNMNEHSSSEELSQTKLLRLATENPPYFYSCLQALNVTRAATVSDYYIDRYVSGTQYPAAQTIQRHVEAFIGRVGFARDLGGAYALVAVTY